MPVTNCCRRRHGSPAREPRSPRGVWSFPGLLLLALLPLALAVSVPVRAETLTQALVKAYQTSPDLRAAWQQLRAANERRPQALASWLPNVSTVGNSGHTYTRQVYGSPYPSMRYNNTAHSGGLQVEQPLTSGGSEFARLDEAENLIRQQRALLIDTEQQVLLNTVDAFTNVIATRAIVEYRRQNLKALRRILVSTESQLAVYDRTLSDVALTRSRVLQAESSLVEAESQAEQAVNFYARVVGERPPKLEPAPPFKAVPTGREDVEDAARRFGPSVLAAAYAEQAAQANITAQKRGLLPGISLQAQVQYKTDYFDQQVQANGMTQTKSLQLQIKVPLYQSGAEHSRVRQAKATAGQRLYELDAARIKAVQEAFDALKQYQAAGQSLELLKGQLAALRVALDHMTQETAAGFRTITDLLNTEQDEINAQVNHATAQRNQTLGSYRVLASIGGLTARSLELPVELYDVEGDYSRIKWKLFGFGPD